MTKRITLKQAIQSVLSAKTFSEVKNVFKDVFGLTEAQIMGRQQIPGLPEPEAPVELTQAAKMVNPKFNKGGGYARNCQRCAPVYDLLRRGILCQACSNPFNDRSGTSKRLSMNGSECYIGAEIHGLDYDRETPIRKKHLIRSLHLLPNGFRANIFWVTPDNKHAHIIVCEKVNGELKFIDPQTGDIGLNVLGEANLENGYYWYRVDELELNPDFEWEEVITYDRK